MLRSPVCLLSPGPSKCQSISWTSGNSLPIRSATSSGRKSSITTCGKGVAARTPRYKQRKDPASSAAKRNRGHLLQQSTQSSLPSVKSRNQPNWAVPAPPTQTSTLRNLPPLLSVAEDADDGVMLDVDAFDVRKTLTA